MAPGADTYDAFSRLTCARSATTACGTSAAAGRVTYTLDAFSRAWQRNENGSILTYSYRGLGETLAKSVLGTTTTKYALTWGGSPLGQKVGTAAASYYLRDPHGDAVGIVSAAGANQGTTAFDPWGKVLGTSGTQPVFGYQSDLTDPLTRQVDMGTRWYAPQTGRFSSQDVLFGDPLHPISLNQWVYGADSPVTMWDPTGMLDAIADGGSSNTLSSCAYGPHPGCRGYDGGVVNGPHVTTYVAPPPPPDPPEPKAFEVVNARAAAMQYAYADAAARASDDDPGCGFFGYHCIARVGGAAVGWVGDKTGVTDYWNTHQLGIEGCFFLCLGIKHDPGLGWGGVNRYRDSRGNQARCNDIDACNHRYDRGNLYGGQFLRREVHFAPKER